MKREFSAGGVVFNKQGQVLLIHSFFQDRGVDYWGFPKGHPEEGETMQQAALREVREESGVTAKVTGKVGDSKYVYTTKETAEKVFKVVSVYLMEYETGDLKDHDSEVAEAGWFSPEEALEQLSFKNDQDLLKKALEIASPSVSSGSQ